MRDDAKMSNTDTRVIRRLGRNEAYQLATYTLDYYRGTIVACRYDLPSNIATVELLKSTVLDAIASVALAQPHLQVGIIGEDSRKPKFVRLDRLDLGHHVEWIPVDDDVEPEPLYQASMKRQLDARYKNLATRPGWKVVVLYQIAAKSMELIYVWNHPHHDGMGGKIFHQQLLRHLNKTREISSQKCQRVSQDWIIDLPDPSNRLPPPPECLTHWSTTAPYLLKAFWEEHKPYSILPPNKTFATWAPIHTSPLATRFHTFDIDSGTLQTVLAACREHQTTLTALLHALTLLSLTTSQTDMEGFASRTPYDVRRFLPSESKMYPWLRPKDSMANYVSIFEHTFDPDLITTIRSKIQRDGKDVILSPDVLEIVWSVSARVRQEIKARLHLAVKNDMIGAMKYVPDWRDQLQSVVRKPRHLSWLVTNLGVLEGNDNDGQALWPEANYGWSIRRAEFVISAEVASAAILVSAITVKDEKLCVTCSWQDCAVDAKVGLNLAADLETWLSNIGS